MKIVLYVFLGIAGLALLQLCVHWLSYSYLKNKVVRSRKWGLNICSGKTDGGGVNADIFYHIEIPNFVHIEDIYNLPFQDKQFDSVLCSHTLEHVDDPYKFYEELQRVGRDVVLLLPPLWDVGAVLNFMEHRWIFLTLRTKHSKIPEYIPLPFARTLQNLLGQRMHA
jgi:hypothetical protein